MEMTLRYAHLTPDVQQAAVATLDRLVDEHGTLMAKLKS
jgi:hypothetical protein